MAAALPEEGEGGGAPGSAPCAPLVEADAVVLVFPSYAFGLPMAVRRFALRAVFRTPYLAAFVTYGSTPGGTLAALSRILRRRQREWRRGGGALESGGIEGGAAKDGPPEGGAPSGAGGIGALFFGRIPAVENYIAIFGAPKEKASARRLAMQAAATEEAVRCVAERRESRVFGFRPISAFVWLLFSLGLRVFHRRYRVSPGCDGCAICEMVCPVGAVSMRGGRPEFSAKCEHCQGCLNWCPKKAIHFGRLDSALARYRHPEINLSDMAGGKRGAGESRRGAPPAQED